MSEFQRAMAYMEGRADHKALWTVWRLWFEDVRGKYRIGRIGAAAVIVLSWAKGKVK